MNELQKQSLIRMLLDKYGNAINVRGIIISPPVGDTQGGEVHFNVIDSRHPEFGRQSKAYFIDPDGNISLT
jgi:hypothetical protein